MQNAEIAVRKFSMRVLMIDGLPETTKRRIADMRDELIDQLAEQERPDGYVSITRATAQGRTRS